MHINYVSRLFLFSHFVGLPFYLRHQWFACCFLLLLSVATSLELVAVDCEPDGLPEVLVVSDFSSSHPLPQKLFKMSQKSSCDAAAENSENKSLLSCLDETSGTLVDTETVSNAKSKGLEISPTPSSNVAGTRDSSVSGGTDPENSGNSFPGYNSDEDDDDHNDDNDSNCPELGNSDNFISHVKA